jgi:glycosyltransferase involved in cell wall biosynthesis
VISVAAFTGGLTVPSARFRVRQYIPTLLRQGVDVDEMYSSFGSFPPNNKLARPFWALATLAKQIPNIVKSHSYDVVLIQREMLSTFATLESLTKAPRVLDVDDAIFLNGNGIAARRLAQISDRVICGNNFLADWFCKWNKHVTVIPTAVDAERYVPSDAWMDCGRKIVIGWIGTSSNLRHVYAIEAALAKILKSYSNAKLRIVCDEMPKFSFIDENRYEFIRWSELTEIDCIQSMHIGIMPLEDTAWARGKCSFKMLQYMSCGIPVVVSPVGMNLEILKMGDVGYGAIKEDEWVDAIAGLIENFELRRKIGSVGRQVVVTSYSVETVAPMIASCLKK